MYTNPQATATSKDGKYNGSDKAESEVVDAAKVNCACTLKNNQKSVDITHHKSYACGSVS